jgi:peptide methionine sulfoxide reductase MsrA
MKYKFRKGDRVVSRDGSYVGTVTRIKERGVAGSDTTYVEWIEVTYDNGLIVQSDPSSFTAVEND